MPAEQSRLHPYPVPGELDLQGVFGVLFVLGVGMMDLHSQAVLVAAALERLTNLCGVGKRAAGFIPAVCGLARRG